jgi:hypothetical protein
MNSGADPWVAGGYLDTQELSTLCAGGAWAYCRHVDGADCEMQMSAPAGSTKVEFLYSHDQFEGQDEMMIITIKNALSTISTLTDDGSFVNCASACFDITVGQSLTILCSTSKIDEQSMWG